jgi:hypothetical protein
MKLIRLTCALSGIILLYSLSALARTDLEIKNDIVTNQVNLTTINSQMKTATDDEKIVLKQSQISTQKTLYKFNKELWNTANGENEFYKLQILELNKQITAIDKKLKNYSAKAKKTKKVEINNLKTKKKSLEKQKQALAKELINSIAEKKETPAAISTIPTAPTAEPATIASLENQKAPAPQRKKYVLPIKMGYGAGTFLIGVEYKTQLEDNFEGGFRLGGGPGNNFNILYMSGFYNLKISGSPMQNSLDLDYFGLSVDCVNFSNNIADIPGTYGIIPKGVHVGGGVFAGKNFGNFDLRAGYSTLLGINLETTVTFTF